MPASAPTLSGTTRVIFIVGDPIAQVKSPAGVTQAFAERGRDAVCLPAHVAPEDLSAWADGVSRARNVDGLIVTVPHKFAAFALCASTTERAAFLGAVNTLRRRPDGRWHGDMFDGEALVRALQARSGARTWRRALLVGAGGAGTAIGRALVDSGVAELSIHDTDPVRRDALVRRLAALGRARISADGPDARGFDLAVNATPLGMRAGDAWPFDISTLSPRTLVACVVTAPAVTPLVEAARGRGCAVVTGTDMFDRVRDLMLDFLMEAS